MRTAIAITLIICGTLLILAPVIHSYMVASQLIDGLALGLDKARIPGSEPMLVLYHFAYWLTGCLMVAVGVICSVRFPALPSPATPAVA